MIYKPFEYFGINFEESLSKKVAKEFKKKAVFYHNMLLEEPIMFKSVLKDIKVSKFDFLEATKKLIGE